MIKKCFNLCNSTEWGSAQKGVKFGYVCVCMTPINAMEDVCILPAPSASTPNECRDGGTKFRASPFFLHIDHLLS